MYCLWYNVSYLLLLQIHVSLILMYMYHCIIIVVPLVAIVQYIHVVALVGLQERREGGRACM